MIKSLIRGHGRTARPGDGVTVNYVGVLFRRRREFDSSWRRHEPFTFTLGSGEVITGFDHGVRGMRVGGRREVVIPARLAYGRRGEPPQIPPNETLVYVIDLLHISHARGHSA